RGAYAEKQLDSNAPDSANAAARAAASSTPPSPHTAPAALLAAGRPTRLAPERGQKRRRVRERRHLPGAHHDVARGHGRTVAALQRLLVRPEHAAREIDAGEDALGSRVRNHLGAELRICRGGAVTPHPAGGHGGVGAERD